MAEMTYRAVEGGRIVIDHAGVSDKLKGQGIGKELVAAAVEWARGEHVKANPVCPFARAIIERNPAFQDVLVSPMAT